MIAILLVYAGVAAAEWQYMRSKKRKTSTIVIMLAFTLTLLSASEVLYLFADRFQLSIVIEVLFGSLERRIVGKGT